MPAFLIHIATGRFSPEIEQHARHGIKGFAILQAPRPFIGRKRQFHLELDESQRIFDHRAVKGETRRFFRMTIGAAQATGAKTDQDDKETKEETWMPLLTHEWSISQNQDQIINSGMVRRKN